MECKKHQRLMIELKGKWFCPDCLAEHRREPVQYLNLAALDEIPVGLRHCRLDNYKKTVKGNEYGFVSSLRKLLDDEQLTGLNFKVLWVHGNQPEDISHLLAGITIERLLHRKSSSYLALSDAVTTQDYNELKEHLFYKLSNKVSCIDHFVESFAVSVYSLLCSKIFADAHLHQRVFVIGSCLSVDQFLAKMPQLKSLFNNYQSLIKEMRIYGK